MRARVLLVSSLCALGCRFDPTVSKTLVIACANDADCPSTFRCEPSVQLCWPEQSDGTPPQLTAFTLTPLASRSTEITLTVTSSEELIDLPRAAFVGAGDRFGPWRRVPGPTPPSYAFSYTPSGDEPEGPVAVQVTLIDASGTVAAPADVGTVTFDFTAPRLVRAAVVYPDLHEALGPLDVGRVDVTLDEDTAARPQLSDPAMQLEPQWSDQLGPVHRFTVRCAAGVQLQGGVTLTLHAVDPAGNSGDVPLAMRVAVDTIVPAAPDTSTPGQVVYRRWPQGTALRPPSFEVEGAERSVEGPGTVVITAPSLGDLELARATSTATGAFGPVALPALDVTRLSVAFVDAAGNRSAAAPVVDTEWTAAVPRGGGGPHRLTVESVATDRYTQSRARALDLGDAGARVESGAAWRRHPTDRDAVGRELLPGTSLLVSAPALGGLIGLNGTTPLVLTGSSTVAAAEWVRLPAADPELDGDPAAISSLAYDAQLRALVVVENARTWLYAGAGWRLIDAASPATGALAYDPDRGATVLANAAGLWLFDGRRWLMTAPAAPLDVYSMAYDEDRAQLVAVGRDAGVAGLTALAQGWVALPPIGTTPSKPVVTTWDPYGRRIIARDFAPGMLCPTTISHAWDGARWSMLGSTPACGAIAIDHAHRAVAQLGLGNGAVATLIAATWYQPPVRPLLVTSPATYDHLLFPLDGRLVKFGGVTATASTIASFYTFTGTHWQNGFTQTLPVHRRGAAVETPEGVMFGSGFGAVVLKSTIYVRPRGDPADAGFQPSTLVSDAGTKLVYEPTRALIYLLETSVQRWVGFDGGSAPGPSGLLPSIVAYDRAGYLVGVFNDGGATGTLRPVDTAWSISPTGGLPQLLDLTTDPASGRALAVTNDSRVFKFDGAGWSALELSDPHGNDVPPPRRNSAVTSSDALGGVYLFGGLAPPLALADGGFLAGQPLDDTWELRTAPHRPAAMLEIDLRSARLPPGTRVLEVVVRATAGADGELDGGAAAGAQVEVWTREGWRGLGANTANASAPQALDATLAGVEAQRAVERARELGVRVTPVGASAAAPSQLEVQVLELTVRARLP